MWGEAVKNSSNGNTFYYSSDGTGQPAHIVGRNCKLTRWIVENGIWATHRLHREMERSKKVAKDLCDKKYGSGHYERLLKVSKGLRTAGECGFREIK